MTRLRLSEPVRLYLYGVSGAAIAVLVGLGVLSASTSALVGGLVVAVLAVPVTEVTRASVYAPKTVIAARSSATTGKHRGVQL